MIKIKILIGNEYYIEDFLIKISLSEALDGVAYKASLELLDIDELSNLNLKKGDKIQIIDKEYNSNKDKTIFNGVIWEISKSKKNKKINLQCRERTVYIEESEDEYQFSSNTARQRIEKYCKDWGIPYEQIPDTKVKLEKVIHKNIKILDMMKKDLKETAQKGGKLYKLRMANKLSLFELGTNKDVYILDSILEDSNSTSSLSGAVTSVKVLGKSKDDKTKTPVIGVYKKNTEKYGTLQKVKQDEKIKNTKEAKKAAEAMFNTGEESTNVDCATDINTIRAGDKVNLFRKDYFVIDITHDFDSMKLNLGELDYIRRKFYSE